jgi:hypothetical protein
VLLECIRLRCDQSKVLTPFFPFSNSKGLPLIDQPLATAHCTALHSSPTSLRTPSHTLHSTRITPQRISALQLAAAAAGQAGEKQADRVAVPRRHPQQQRSGPALSPPGVAMSSPSKRRDMDVMKL